MKLKYIWLIPILLLTGCGIIPKKVEYFQDKVEKAPQLGYKDEEVLRQAAKLANERAQETKEAAIATQADPSVVIPATDTERLTDAVSDAVGQPKKDYEGEMEALLVQLQKVMGELNEERAKFRDRNDENAGKKIEGTGIIQMPYITNLLLIGVVLVVVWAMLKTASAVNAPVSVGVKTIEGGTKLVARAAGEIIQAGQEFKRRLIEEMPEQAAAVKKIFTEAHRANQSTETQQFVQQIKT